jgi:predicted nucleic acid-binding protein
MIVDASVILRAFFPDQAQAKAQELVGEHIAGRLRLKAPALLPYELSNAVWQAERRGRISANLGDEILQAMRDLEIEILTQAWGEMLPLARQFGRSAHDAAYLSLGQSLGEPFITGDERLYHAVQPHLKWVRWIEEYSAEAGP